MNNFVFQNPTKILFGKGSIAQIGKELPADAKILLCYGGGSIKTNGVYDQVVAALADRAFDSFGGIEANPTYETLTPGVEKIKTEGFDFLLAVGGGSVLDAVKYLAAAAKYDGDGWDILEKRTTVTDVLPIGTVLTLPGTGSEMNGASVISKTATGQKLAFITPHVFPKWSVLDPETTFTLPPRQIGNGVVDAFMHVLEQYLTYPADAPLQDRFAESVLQTLREEGPKTLANPTDYTSRANVMWCATMALNGVISVGVPQDWASHMIGHEITALYGMDHAQTLACVAPSLYTVTRGAKAAKLAQMGVRVFGISGGGTDELADKAIAAVRDFFETMGVKTKLADYGVNGDAPDAVVNALARQGAIKYGVSGEITADVVREIVAGAA